MSVFFKASASSVSESLNASCVPLNKAVGAVLG
jgi:hypothetical protein